MAESQDITARADWAKKHTSVDYLPHRVEVDTRPDGVIILRSGYEMKEPVRNTGQWLHKWAKDSPERVMVRERQPGVSGWFSLNYRQLLAQVRAVASVLVANNLGPQDPIAILSGNSVNHLILSLAGQYAGIPVVPLAEQYSLVPEARDRLVYVARKVKPKLVFAQDATRFADALNIPEFNEAMIVASSGALAGGRVRPFNDLLKGDSSIDIDGINTGVGPHTLAKILFTSGSSSDPKGVLVTHGMMCANQEQFSGSLPCLEVRPPQMVDWLPWNHVFGGNNNVNMILRNGGTLTIDSGKPVQSLFDASVRNRRELGGNIWFDVPAGFAMMMNAANEDDELLESLVSDLDLLLYAGASLPQNVWEEIEQACFKVRGSLPLMLSSWGLTETAPSSLLVHEPIGRSGVIGVPVPGIEVKLTEQEPERFEIRVKGPNVTPGYFGDREKTDQAFDSEGFFITGDAVRFVDRNNPAMGLIFDGRISEDFKLETGTWVQAGTLRINALKALSGIAQELVICGHERSEVGVLIFAHDAKVSDADESSGAYIAPSIQAEIAQRLRSLNKQASGSSKRISRAIIAIAPPSVSGKEITDKGSLNVHNIIRNRPTLIDRLYDNDDPALIRV